MKLKNLDRLETIIISALIFLLPLFILPVFPNVFITPKVLLLGSTISILLLIKSLKIILKGSLGFNSSQFDLPILLLFISFLASALLQSPNKFEAFFLPGPAAILSFSIILYILINQFNTKAKNSLSYTIVVSGIFFSSFILISTSGILKNSSLPNFVKQTNFTTLGDILSSIVFLTTIIPLSINLAAREKDVFRKVFWGISTTLITFALTISIFNILPGKPNAITLPSFKTSWIITVDSLKEKPLLGIGPGNYLTAFNRFRPVEYNQTILWSVRFTSARNFYFTLITEGGLLSTAALIFLFYLIIKLITQGNTPAILSLTILSLLFAIFPGNPTNIVLFFVLLAINSTTKTLRITTLSSSEELTSKIPNIITILPICIIAITILFYTAKSADAEYTYKTALDTIASGNGGSAYSLMQKTINLKPQVDKYHITFAQLNLALADSIARKDNITDDERNTISNLIQQSIQSGKNAINLNPSRAENWEVLAQIYQQITPIAQNANDFAIQTYSQAINLDPLNPNLRIALGNIYFANKNYDDAIKVFELATVVKPDLPNAHYNLAFAYKEGGKLDKAINELTTTFSLVDQNSKDYDTVKKALENLQTQKKSEVPASSNLTPTPLTQPSPTPLP